MSAETPRTGTLGETLRQEGFAITEGFLPYGISTSDIAQGKGTAYQAVEIKPGEKTTIEALQLLGSDFFPELGNKNERILYVLGTKGAARIKKGEDQDSIELIKEDGLRLKGLLTHRELQLSFAKGAENVLSVVDLHVPLLPSVPEGISIHVSVEDAGYYSQAVTAAEDIGEVQAIWVQSQKQTQSHIVNRFGFFRDAWKPYYSLDFFTPPGRIRQIDNTRRALRAFGDAARTMRHSH